MSSCVKLTQGYRNGQGHTEEITGLACVGSGKAERLVTASADGTIRVWLTSSSECVACMHMVGEVLDMAVWESTKPGAHRRIIHKSFRLVVALSKQEFAQEIELDEERNLRRFAGEAHSVKVLPTQQVLLTLGKGSHGGEGDPA